MPIDRSKTGYQPTYEELKLDRVADMIEAHFRYQPTYEELKPRVFAFACVVPSGGYQPTYEELKRRYAAVKELGLARYQPTYEELKPTYKNSK